MRKCRYHCDYGDGENCHYTGQRDCVYNERQAKPIRLGEESYKCPKCFILVERKMRYCWNCGERLDWNDERT